MSKRPSQEALMREYGWALALVADASPAERTQRLKALSLDESAFQALSAKGDAQVSEAIAAKDVPGRVAFKTAFDAGRVKVETDRKAQVAPPPPPPPPASPLYVVRAPAAAEPIAMLPVTRRAPSPLFPARAVAPLAPPPPRMGASSFRAAARAMIEAPATLPRPAAPSHVSLSGSLALEEEAPETESPSEKTLQPASTEQGMSLMQYAALRADVISSTDAERPAVYARYGLTAQTDLEEAARWNERFNQDRALFAQYMQLFKYLRSLSRR
jgi:hypothetical protein